jgi:hypothetical protein
MIGRARLYSTTLLQAQILACCCREQPAIPVRLVHVEPRDGDVFQLDPQSTDPAGGGPDRILLVFNKAVKRETLRPAILVTASKNEGPAEIVRPKQVRYDQAANTAVFLPKIPFADIARGSTTTFYIRVTGDDPGGVVDVDGLALDGNADGTPGGNFTSQFRIEWDEIPF